MRLVTRSDFDGIVCGALLYHIGVIDSWLFTHPKDIQDGKIEVNENDVLANVPYAQGCGLWFDHHVSEEIRLQELLKTVKGDCRKAPSAARVIWDYYGGHKAFPKRFDAMMEGVDKVDSANLTADEILATDGWIGMGFLTDPRTGLGRFRNFRISNKELMSHLIYYLASFPIEIIATLPDITERRDLYLSETEKHKEMLKRVSKVDNHCVVIDFRNEEIIHAGNRFLVYALYPEVKVSIHVAWGFQKQNIAISVGKSITNFTDKVNIGEIMLEHGGGGHFNVGTCQVPPSELDKTLKEIIDKINSRCDS